MNTRFLLWFIIAASMAAAINSGRADEPPTPGRASRLAPPSEAGCNRNQLTSWFGVVSGYRREAEQTWLEISTDYDTVEQVTIAPAGPTGFLTHYLLWGEPFTENDWAVIETSPGVLNPGMRAIVWVCDDGITAPLVDWQPPRE